MCLPDLRLYFFINYVEPSDTKPQSVSVDEEGDTSSTPTGKKGTSGTKKSRRKERDSASKESQESKVIYDRVR